MIGAEAGEIGIDNCEAGTEKGRMGAEARPHGPQENGMRGIGREGIIFLSEKCLRAARRHRR